MTFFKTLISLIIISLLLLSNSLSDSHDNEQNIIEKDLSEVFTNTSPRRGKTTFPDDVESTLINVEFNLPKFDIVVSCTDWSKKSEALGNTDNLRVEISSLEFSNFLRHEAY